MAEGKKELSMEQRLLLVFVLAGVVIFVSQYFMPKPPQPAPQKKAAVEQAKPAAAAPSDPKSAAADPPAAAGAAPVQVGQQAEYPVFENSLYRVKFSNKGAVVLEWSLKAYKDNNGKPLNLVNEANATQLGSRPFAYQYKDQKPSSDLNEKLFAVSRSADGIPFDYNDGTTTARKYFRFVHGRYLVEVDSAVS